MATLDWDSMIKTDEAANTPAPPGTYVLEVKSAKWGKSKAGDPQLAITLQIAEGPNKGRAVWNRLTFNMEKPGAIGMAFRFLEALGLPPKEFKQFTPSQQEEKCVGRRVECELVVKEFQGRHTNEIKRTIRGLGGAGAPGGLTPPPMDGAPTPPPAAPANPLA